MGIATCRAAETSNHGLRFITLLDGCSSNMTASKSSGSGVCSLRNPLWPRSRTGRRQHLFAQRLTKHLAHVVNKHETNVFEWLFRNFVEIPTVLLRKDNRCHPCASSCKYFFLHAADWQHVPAQSDLARHRHVLANRSARQG